MLLSISFTIRVRYRSTVSYRRHPQMLTLVFRDRVRLFFTARILCIDKTTTSTTLFGFADQIPCRPPFEGR
jgi:hypothetical protein